MNFRPFIGVILFHPIYNDGFFGGPPYNHQPTQAQRHDDAQLLEDLCFTRIQTWNPMPAKKDSASGAYGVQDYFSRHLGECLVISSKICQVDPYIIYHISYIIISSLL